MYFANTDKLLSVNRGERERLLYACADAKRALDIDAASRERKSGKTSTERQIHNNEVACTAAKEYLEKKAPNASVYYLGPEKTGEINELAKELSGILRRIARKESDKYKAPCFVIQGYVNTTIKMEPGQPKSYGGKSIHQAMIMAKELEDETGITGICMKTNWDGNTCSIAGIFDHNTSIMLSKTGNLDRSIKENDSFAVMKGIRSVLDGHKEPKDRNTDLANKARFTIASVNVR